MLVLALSIAGCEYIGPQLHQKLPIAENQRIGDDQPIPELANADKSAENRTTKVELFPNGEASITAHNTPSTAAKSGAKGEYSLNFDDADLGEVAKVILSDIMGRNYTISPQVTGKVTL